MKDYVKCCNCSFIGTVELGGEICPECNKSGALAWVDEDKQEVNQ